MHGCLHYGVEEGGDSVAPRWSPLLAELLITGYPPINVTDEKTSYHPLLIFFYVGITRHHGRCRRGLLLLWSIPHEHDFSLNINPSAGVLCMCRRVGVVICGKAHTQYSMEGTAQTSIVATREAAVPFLDHQTPRLWGWDITTISIQIQQSINCGGAKANGGLNIEISQNIVPRFLLSNILIFCWPLAHIMIEVKNDDSSLDYASRLPPPLLS